MSCSGCESQFACLVGTIASVIGVTLATNWVFGLVTLMRSRILGKTFVQKVEGRKMTFLYFRKSRKDWQGKSVAAMGTPVRYTIAYPANRDRVITTAHIAARITSFFELSNMRCPSRKTLDTFKIMEI